jgi:hypothetical protein
VGIKEKTGKIFTGDILDEEEEDEPLSCKTIIINEKWVGQTTEKKQTSTRLCEQKFGDALAHKLKSSVRGFVDVPGGDFKPCSHLHLHSH